MAARLPVGEIRRGHRESTAGKMSTISSGTRTTHGREEFHHGGRLERVAKFRDLVTPSLLGLAESYNWKMAAFVASILRSKVSMNMRFVQRNAYVQTRAKTKCLISLLKRGYPMRIYTWIRERTLFFKIINYERLKDSFISYC